MTAQKILSNIKYVLVEMVNICLLPDHSRPDWDFNETLEERNRRHELLHSLPLYDDTTITYNKCKCCGSLVRRYEPTESEDNNL